MSEPADRPPYAGDPASPVVEVTDSRTGQVGRIQVRRALPRKGRRTVGAWCFADHMGPADVTESAGLEHAVVVLDGAATVDGIPVAPGTLAYLGLGRDELGIDVDHQTRVVLIGGEPFPEPILMWWNFVARNRSEIDAAHTDWAVRSGRFGTVRSPLPLIPAPRPYWQESA